MQTSAAIWFLLTVIGIVIMARIALKWLRIAQILKQICRGLIVINFRLQKKVLTDEEIDAELERLMEEFEI